MNELPVHVLLKVLDCLPTLDAIRYRAVCKCWLDLIDQFVLDELNVFHYQRQYTKYLQFRKCFMDPNRSISFDGSLYKLVFGNEKFAFLFRNLKKFAFVQDSSWNYNFDELEKLINSFVNLEHLYLVTPSLISIKLAKLKTFDCSFSNLNLNARKGSKRLDCPELQALAIDCEETDEPVLNCPKLRYLKYVHYSPWISRLDSLEVLNLGKLKNSEDILSNHPNLHTINVFSVQKAVLSELVRSGRELRRDHLKVFVKSLPVDDELLEAFDEVFDEVFDNRWWRLGYFKAKGVELYAKHEQEFRDDFFVFDEYSGIWITSETIANLKLLTDRTPIFRKVRRTHRLWAKGQSFSQEELIDLIKQTPNAHELTCDDIALDQAFFDQLPTILPFLYMLRITNKLEGLKDYSFVLKFRELENFLPKEYWSDENSKILTELEKRTLLDFDYKKKTFH